MQSSKVRSKNIPTPPSPAASAPPPPSTASASTTPSPPALPSSILPFATKVSAL